MNIEETKHRLGSFVDRLSIAESYQSRDDVIAKMCDYITTKKYDVDDSYLEFVNNIDKSAVRVDVKYVPVYRVTSLARLYWKEHKENEEAIEHQEFVRFTCVFDAEEYNKKNRINNLNILKIIDKKDSKPQEEIYDQIESYSSDGVLMIGTNDNFVPAVVMDVPLEDNNIYPLETSYIISKSDIEKKVDGALKLTKSYKRLSKQKEKWSSIEKMEVEVVLVPIAIVRIGEHDQYVNCANGEFDIQYEQNRLITENLKMARMMSYPAVIITGALLIGTFFTMWNLEYKFTELPQHILGNLTDIIWLILLVLGVVLSLVAIPTRKGIVKRASLNKDRLKICKIASRLLIDVIVALLVMLLMSI